MNAIVKAAASQQATSLVPQNMDQALRFAEMMSISKMLPKHLQGDIGTCFMVVEQSMRWNMSPFAVAQCTSNIGGKLMYEGKLVAAVATACNGIVGEFDYVFAGDPLKPETLSVTASAVRASDGQKKSIDLKWVDAKTTNAFWLKQPEQQLSYAAARVWCRRWAPGTMLGVYSPEEFDKQPQQQEFSGTTIEATPPDARAAMNAEIDGKAMDARAQVYATPAPAPPKRTARDLINEIKVQLDDAGGDIDAVDAVAGSDVVQKALAWFQKTGKTTALDELNALLADAIERVNAKAEEASAAEPTMGELIDDTIPF